MVSGYLLLSVVSMSCCISWRTGRSNAKPHRPCALGPVSWPGHQLILTTSLHQGKSSHPCIFFSWWSLCYFCFHFCNKSFPSKSLLLHFDAIIGTSFLIAQLTISLLLLFQLLVLLSLNQWKLPSPQKLSKNCFVRQRLCKNIRKILQTIYPSNMGSWKPHCLSQQGTFNGHPLVCASWSSILLQIVKHRLGIGDIHAGAPLNNWGPVLKVHIARQSFLKQHCCPITCLHRLC